LTFGIAEISVPRPDRRCAGRCNHKSQLQMGCSLDDSIAWHTISVQYVLGTPQSHEARLDGVTTSIYYADPDDNLVELQADNFEKNRNASTDWMRTAPAFAENPVGDFFDAEAIYRDHLDGKPFDQIRTGISKGAYAPSKAPNLRLPAP